MIEGIDSGKLHLAKGRLSIITRPISQTIIAMLEEQEKMTVTAIQKKLNASQSKASYYLLNMKRKGILNSDRNGHEIYYSVNFDMINRIIEGVAICANSPVTL